MSVALVMFNLDEPEGILRNARSLHAAVDEITVVDSSPTEHHYDLKDRAAEYSAQVHHALPMGFPEPLRPFALSKVKSERALIVDADEDVSDRLRSDLRVFTDREAYVLPRLEEQLDSYSYHLRLVRCESVRYRGRSFDFPQVTGRLGWLGRSHSIVHHAGYGTFFADKSRAERYLTIENVERPFLRSYAADGLTVRLRDRSLSLPPAKSFRRNADGILSPEAVRAVIEFEFLRDVFLAKGLKAASFSRRYSLSKWRFLRSLPESQRSLLLAIARDVQLSGGLFEYLGFSDPGYVEKLTASFRWNRRGIDVYRSLLEYRYRFGKVANAVPSK